MKETNRKTQTNAHRRAAALLTGLLLIAALTVPAAAAETGGGLTGSTLYTGTMQLVNDIGTVVTIACPVICGVVAIVFAIRRSMADEQEGKMWMKRIITAIACGVGGGLIAGIITLISSYYV